MTTPNQPDLHTVARLITISLASLWLRIRLAVRYRSMPTGPLDTLIGTLLSEPLRIAPADLYENIHVEMLAFYWQYHKQPCTLDQVVSRAKTIYQRYVLGSDYTLAKQYWIRARIEIALIDSIGQPIDLLLQHDQLLIKRVLKASQE